MDQIDGRYISGTQKTKTGQFSETPEDTSAQEHYHRGVKIQNKTTVRELYDHDASRN